MTSRDKEDGETAGSQETSGGVPGVVYAVQSRLDSLFDATIGKLWVARFWDGLDRQSISNRQRLLRLDGIIALAFALLGAAISIWAFYQTNRVPNIHSTIDVFLHADVARWAQSMVSTEGSHGRSSVHPIFPLLLYPFGGGLTALGVEPLFAAKILITLIMSANAALFSLIARLAGLPRLAAASFSILFVFSASFMTWSGVVESFQFSCFSVLVTLFLMLRVEKSHYGWWILANVLTLGLLVTNWMFGLIATAVRHKLKPFIAITVSSFFVVVVLSLVQNATFEKAALFFNPETLLRETQYLQPAMEAEGTYEDGWRPDASLRSILVTTVVAMPIEVQEFKRSHVATTNQNIGLNQMDAIGILAVSLWVILLGLGVWGATKCRELRLPILGVGTMLLGQAALHMLYGEVTFLYSPSFLPLLLFIACLAWYSPYRQVGLGVLAVATVSAGVNNERRLQETIDAAGCLLSIESVRKIQTRDLSNPNMLSEIEAYIEEFGKPVIDQCNPVRSSQTD